MIYKVGRELEVKVEDVAFGGNGVARLDGLVCFIPFSIPGETVKIRITSVKKRFLEAEIVEVIEQSENRVEPKCELYGECGGCQYQHIDYKTQLSLKESQLKQVLSRIGSLSELPEIEKIVPSPKEFHYRNRITLNAKKQDDNFIVYGYKHLNNQDTLEIQNCPIAQYEVSDLTRVLKRTPWGHKNLNRQRPKPATLRCSGGDDPVIYYGKAPKGMPWRTEKLAGRDFRVPLGAFYQVNPEVAEELFSITTEWLNELPQPKVIDAFCGAGFLSMGLEDKHVVGIEENEASIEAAEYNALQWGIKSFNYIAGDANKLINKHLRNKGDSTILILDPPRKGCGESTLESIRKHKPSHILYVSCDPATLARDLKGICGESNYKVSKLALLDMFPQTSHFETMVLLKKGDADV
ncbi:MAG: class I SAM-dependent RNA methyltransferase [Lentisphaeraceae bacterium]|nr:class I SAM-dependent RNA methyltransferase [Lentisphaeraceae bacterium]